MMLKKMKIRKTPAIKMVMKSTMNPPNPSKKARNMRNPLMKNLPNLSKSTLTKKNLLTTKRKTMILKMILIILMIRKAQQNANYAATVSGK